MEVKKDGGRFSASPPCTRGSEAEISKWGLYHLLEKFLFRPAKRTNPIIGKSVKGCAGFDAVLTIPFRRIVHIPAGAFIFIHGLLLIVDIDPRRNRDGVTRWNLLYLEESPRLCTAHRTFIRRLVFTGIAAYGANIIIRRFELIQIVEGFLV